MDDARAGFVCHFAENDIDVLARHLINATMPVLFGVSYAPLALAMGKAGRPFVGIAPGVYVQTASSTSTLPPFATETSSETVLGARFIVGADLFRSHTAENVLEVFRVAVHRPGDERRLCSQGKRHRDEGGIDHAGGSRFGDLAEDRRRRVLPLGQAVNAVVLEDAAVLAEHFERGHEPARARRWYMRAAEQALGGNDLAVVVEAAERGGIDLVMVYNTGPFRMAGHGSLAGYLAYGDSTSGAPQVMFARWPAP